MSDKRFCEKCGTEIVAGNSFCTGCGSSVVDATKSPPPKTEQEPPVPPPSTEPERTVPPPSNVPSPPPSAAPPSQPSAPPPQSNSYAPHPSAGPPSQPSAPIAPAAKQSVTLIVLLVIVGVVVLGGGGYWAYNEFVAVAPAVEPPAGPPDPTGPSGTSQSGPPNSSGTPSGSGAGQSGSTPPLNRLDAVPPAQTNAGFSVANGKVSLELPGSWRTEETSANYIVASRDAGVGNGSRLTLILSDIDYLLPIAVDELHELHIDETYDIVDPEFGFEFIEEDTRTLPNGMLVMSSTVSESSVDSPLFMLLMTSIHNGHACWVEINGYEDVADEVNSEVEAIIDSLRMER